MDIHSFFSGASSSKSADDSSSCEDEVDRNQSDRMLGPKSCKETINCPSEVQEQVPVSYKQSKIQEMGRELYLADIR